MTAIAQKDDLDEQREENRGSWLRESRQLDKQWKDTIGKYSDNHCRYYKSYHHEDVDTYSPINAFDGISPYDPDLNAVSLPKEILDKAITNSRRRIPYAWWRRDDKGEE